MAHHGQDPLYPEATETLRKMTELQDEVRNILGDTGRYPQGALTKDDEGELRYAVGTKDGKVCIDFGKPVAWVGMDADQALELACTLVKQAANAKGRPITMRLELA